MICFCGSAKFPALREERGRASLFMVVTYLTATKRAGAAPRSSVRLNRSAIIRPVFSRHESTEPSSSGRGG